jgi:hypothetical protein
VSEQAEAGADPRHRRVEFDVVILEPDGVALERAHPLEQEGVHHIVLGPVVVVDQTGDGGESAAERGRALRIAAGQSFRGVDKAQAVGAHRLVHCDQDAAVLGDRDGRGVAYLGIRHVYSSMLLRERTWLLAAPGGSAVPWPRPR